MSMRKFILSFLGAIIITSCGVGSYSVSSGKADEAMVSFVSSQEIAISVTIDGKNYSLVSVKADAWKKDRNIKKTAKNTIYIAPGQHEVEVQIEGKEVCHKKIFVSTQEHKIIEL